MAVAEQGGTWRNRFLVDYCATAGVGGFACSELVELAEEAAAAGDHERNHHAVTDLQIGDPATGFLDDAHELVAEDITRLGLWNLAVVEVQVGAADGGGGDPEDNVVLFLDERVGDIVDPDVLGSVVCQCSHGFISCRGGTGWSMQGKPGGEVKFRWNHPVAGFSARRKL
ncbi:hypothetical protein D3C79_740820 [compost metagenome]